MMVAMVTRPTRRPRRSTTSALPVLPMSIASSASWRVDCAVTRGRFGSAATGRVRIRSTCRRDNHCTARPEESASTTFSSPAATMPASTSAGAVSAAATWASTSSTSPTLLRVSCLRPAPEPMKLSTKSSAGLARMRSGESYCTSRAPSSNTAIQSPSFTASSKSWVTHTMVFCSSAWMLSSSFCSR